MNDTAMPGDIRLQQVADRRDLKRFLEMPVPLYRDDPNWVHPLMLERLQHLDAKKNPFFDRAEVAYWIATKDGRDVGRISAQVNRAHLEKYNDATGHFGFLEAEDNPAIFAALFATAEQWLKERGMRRAVGPFTLSVNDESGLLIEGFDTPPYVMMGHTRRYYPARVEEQGYAKVVDLIAYHYDITAEPSRAAKSFVRKLSREPGVRLRPIDMKRFKDDIGVIMDIYNDAWADNWSSVPMTVTEAEHLGNTLKAIIKPEFVCIAEIEGEPAAMAVSFPNINEAIRDLDGRLLPFGWAKLLWRLKVKGLRTGRLPLMGVRTKFRNSPLGAALAIGVIDAIRQAHRRFGTEEAELSWILETNTPMRNMIEMVGAKPYKTYRMYEKELG